MTSKINVTLALSPEAYNLLKEVSDYTNLTRSEVVNRLILAHANALKSTDDTSTTQTPKPKNQGDQPIVPAPAAQNHEYDFFTKTDRLILEDKPKDSPIYEDYGQSSDDIFPDDPVYGPIED